MSCWGKVARKAPRKLLFPAKKYNWKSIFTFGSKGSADVDFLFFVFLFFNSILLSAFYLYTHLATRVRPCSQLKV